MNISIFCKEADYMKSYSEAMYWKTNKKWYKANFETNSYELTNLASPRAIDSFRLYLKENKKEINQSK